MFGKSCFYNFHIDLLFLVVRYKWSPFTTSLISEQKAGPHIVDQRGSQLALFHTLDILVLFTSTIHIELFIGIGTADWSGAGMTSFAGVRVPTETDHMAIPLSYHVATPRIIRITPFTMVVFAMSWRLVKPLSGGEMKVCENIYKNSKYDNRKI